MKKIFFIFGILIVAAIIFSVALKPQKQKIEQEAKLKPRELRVELRETGGVYPRNKLEIKPTIAGRIEEILVQEGDEIKKGQIVIWMSSNERAAMIDAARTIGEEEYQLWKNIYKPMPIIAPLDGFIIHRLKEPGQTVADSILVMADDLIVEVNIDETDLRYIQIGKKVEMYLDAYRDEEFDGVIEHISYDAISVSNVTMYNVKIKPIKKPKVFRSGMTATITITAESKKEAQSIPSAFITEKEHKQTVVVKAGTENKPVFETREVVTGVTDGKYTEILSGLNPGETVVILSKKVKPKKKSALAAG
jgi:macrolide-specific efflux system membrane fusion protein